MMNGNQQQMGVGMMGIGAAAIIQGMQGNPEDDARQQAAAAERARQAQLEKEQAEQRAEESKNRLLGELLDTDSQVDKQVVNQNIAVNNEPTLSGLPLMTDEISASAPALPSKPATDSLPQGKAKTEAFKKGFQDASQCFSSSAGTYCNQVTSDQLQSCVADYNGGFNTGSKHLRLIMDEAFGAGKEDGKNGELANGPTDPRAEGPCRTSWIEAYNRGYFQGKQTK